MEKLLKLFSDCIPVRGYSKSIICDITRGDIIEIPNSLFEFIEAFQGKDKNYIINQYSNPEDLEVINQYIDTLEKLEVIFWCNPLEFDSFPNINTKWSLPQELQCAIIDFNPNIININSIKELDKLGVEHYQFRILDMSNIDFDLFDSFLENFIVFFYRLKTFEIITNYNKELEELLIKKITKYLVFLREITFYNAPLNKTELVSEIHFNYLNKNFNESENRSNIIKNRFFSNIDFYCESQKFNTYYNKKIFIDFKGNIKNCLNSSFSFGSLNKLNEIIFNKNFTSLWLASKDKIKDCKLCEYRYVCFDDRPLKFDEKEKLYYSDIICNYDPVEGKWK